MKTKHARTLEVAKGMDINQIRALVDRWCRPDMLIACSKKFGFELDKDTLMWLLAEEEAHLMFLDNVDEVVYKNIRFEDCPDGLHESTFNIAVELDENQFDALIERYCEDKRARQQSVKMFGFELDRKTLEWLKKNKPIYEFLE
jgi:hypothetical protein